MNLFSVLPGLLPPSTPAVEESSREQEPSSQSISETLITAEELEAIAHAQVAHTQIADAQIAEAQNEQDSTASSSNLSPQTELKIAASTFLTIFLAELGDKTQVTTLLMSAESHSPITVFLGAGSALVLTSLLGVLVGRWLSKHISPKTLETSSGVILLVISAMLFWDVLQG